MAIPFALMGVGAVLVFLGLLNGEVSTALNIVKFSGLVLGVIGLVASARVSVKRRQALRVENLREGLPQVEPLGRGGASH